MARKNGPAKGKIGGRTASNGLGRADGHGGYAPIEQYDEKAVTSIGAQYSDILRSIGEDPKREGLKKTPERVAKALQYLTHGYDLDPAAILSSALYREEYSQMVLVKDIEVYSLCEHHMLPFIGKEIGRASCRESVR